MTHTIETTHTKILQKLDIIGISIDELKLVENNNQNDEDINNINELQKRFNDIKEDYNLSTMSTLTSYYLHGDTKNTKSEFIQIITTNNYIAAINELSRELKINIGVIFPQYTAIINHVQAHGGDIMGVMSQERPTKGRKSKKTNEQIIISKSVSDDAKRVIEKLLRELSIADSIDVEQQLVRSDYEICECGEKMIVAPTSSELFCPNDDCGEIRILHGTVFEDYQFYNQDGQKTKHGSYTHMRHLKFWIERIQARENKEFSKSEHGKIDHCIKRDGMLISEINCMVMRNYLKECKLTGLNNHAPLLVRIKTGKVPPQLTYNETNELSIKFSKLMEYYDRLNPEETFDRQNKPYYPYFIYKILENMFCKSSKIRILECIHLQSRETVIDNDLIYEKICDSSNGEFTFKPTDRNEHM